MRFPLFMLEQPANSCKARRLHGRASRAAQPILEDVIEVTPTTPSEAGSGRPSLRSITIAVPCFNEGPAIAPLSARLLPVIEDLQSRWKVHILCIDDGSTDDTLALLRKHFDHMPGITADIVRHSANRGLAETMRTALSKARGDIVCALDCNSTYDPKDVRGMVQQLQSEDADIVVASPFHPQGGLPNLPAWKMACARAISRLNARLLPGRLTCYTSMFRAYRREWFNTEFLRSSDFQNLAQILVGATIAGAKVIEYPVVLKHESRRRPARRTARATLDHLVLLGSMLLRGTPRRRESEPGYITLQEKSKRRPSA